MARVQIPDVTAPPPSTREINWDYVGDAVPAFITILTIPLTYNIAYGVIAGLATYIVINGPAWLIRKATGITPPNYDLAERWVIPPGGIVPGWIKVLAGTSEVAHNEVQLQQRHSPSSVDEHSHEHTKDASSFDAI